MALAICRGGVRREVLTQMGNLPPACKACATDGDNQPAATTDERRRNIGIAMLSGTPRASSMDTTIDDDFEEEAGGGPSDYDSEQRRDRAVPAWQPAKGSPASVYDGTGSPVRMGRTSRCSCAVVDAVFLVHATRNHEQFPASACV